jgi:hypothetical protein
MNPPELVGTDQFEKFAGNFQTFACRSLKLYNEFLPRLLRRSLVANIQPNTIPELIIDRVKEPLIELFKTFP